MERLFFSYARVDSIFALRLAKDLRQANVNIWIDQLDIKAGSRWDAAVEDGLNSSPSVIVILSPESVTSNNVMDEVSFALENEKKVIPVLFKECKVPFRLRVLQRVDFSGDYQMGLNNLINSLNIPIDTNHNTVITENDNKDIEFEEAGITLKETRASKLTSGLEPQKSEDDKINEIQVVEKNRKSKIFYILIGGVILISIFIWGIINTGNWGEQRAWNMASKLNDSSSYAGYLEKYPKGIYNEQARNRIDSISKEKDYTNIMRIKDSIDAAYKALPDKSKVTEIDFIGNKTDKLNSKPFRNFSEALLAVFNDARYDFKKFKGEPFPDNPENFRTKISIADKSISPSNIFYGNNEWAFRFVADGLKVDENLYYQQRDAAIKKVMFDHGLKYKKTVKQFGKGDTPIDSFQYEDNTGYRVIFLRAFSEDKFIHDIIVYHAIKK